MPVTELAFFTYPTTAHNGAITPEFKAACSEAVNVQDAWCAANLPNAPGGGHHEARGAALFQQVEDPAVVLLTAHWASVAEHGLWIASEQNHLVFATIKEHIDPVNIRFFHVDGVEAFSNAEEEPEATPVLKSPVVGMERFSVAKDRKAEFERVYGGMKGIKEEAVRPYVHRGGWRIEKEEGKENVEEYVVIGGWDSVEASDGFSKHKDSSKYSEAIAEVTLDREVRHYKRIL